MRVIISPIAQDTILEVAEFVEGINTTGAGDRWTDKILDFIASYAQPKAKYSLCRDKDLRKKLLSCVAYKNWVIAFKIEDDIFFVHQIIYGPILQ